MTAYENDPTATIFLLAARLRELGYSDNTVQYGGIPYHTFTKNGRSWISKGFKISYPFNTTTVSEISVDKAVGYDFARQHGVAIPATVSINPADEEFVQAKALLQQYKKIIIKPLDASLAHGVSLNIKTIADMEQAIEAARHYSDIVLAQQQVYGDELRFAVVNGKAVAALLRQTARVTGDGLRTIAELLRAENEVRAKLDASYFTYPQLDETLIDPALLTDERILDADEVLELSHSAMVRYGASMYNVISDVDPSYIDIVEQLGSALSRDFIVVDVMIANYRTARTADNYWFIEFNTSPILKLFHGTRDGNSVDIVGLVAERIDHSVQKD